MIVHVILPSGTRFESPWKDGTPDNKILAALSNNKGMFGRVRKVTKEDTTFTLADGSHPKVEFDDVTAPYCYDHPDTVVDVVNEKGETVRRLKGTPPVSASAT